MTKGYPYPEDEFDLAAGADGPRGGHRRPRSAWSRTWPFLAVLVVCSGLAYGGVLLASSTGRGGAGQGGAGTSLSDAVGPTSAATDLPTSPGEASPTGEQPPPAAEPAPAASPTPTAELATPVRVLNAAGVQGLAATKQQLLTAAGFTDVTAGNAGAGGLTATTVFYSSADLRPTADRVAATLGVTAVELSATRANGGVTVILLRDALG